MYNQTLYNTERIIFLCSPQFTLFAPPSSWSKTSPALSKASKGESARSRGALEPRGYTRTASRPAPNSALLNDFVEDIADNDELARMRDVHAIQLKF